ncbi:MAG: glycosyltransferase family 2 protein [Candidatus Aminicenantes bacterium]|nr:glycosyltransferase family 2 protein [Candidatus Aminicenantes bacterium]
MRPDRIPDISVVILCYKTGNKAKEFVKKVLCEMDELEVEYEIILVGNYMKDDSSDDTPRAVQEIASYNSKIKALTLEKKGMMGWDARTGLEAATGKTIALIDGDGQMPPSDLTKAYRKLKKENLDMVKTYREKRYDGLARKINSNIYNSVFRLLFPGFKVRDVNSKPKIFTRGFFNKLELTADDWFLDAEIMIQTRRHKGKLGEIPTLFFESEARKSFVKVIHIWEFLKNLLKARIKEFSHGK